MTELIHKNLTYKVRGTLFDVHNALGPMLPEAFVRDAIAICLEEKGISCITEKQFTVYYRGVDVGRYFVDIWIEDGNLLLELKVVPQLEAIHQAQAISYLKVTNADLALLANFGTALVEVQRLPNFVRDKQVEFQWESKHTHIETPYPQLMEELLAVLYRVHFELGPGFLHQVYRRATMIELRHQEVGFRYLKKTPIYFHGHHLGDQETRLINVEDKILTATIAVRMVTEEMKAHLRVKMRFHDLDVGIIGNFHRAKLEIHLVRGGGNNG